MNIRESVSADGSHTLFNEEYQESYHSLKDGAINETMQKHVLPPLDCLDLMSRPKIRILDICFGLGYNSFFTIYAFLLRQYCGEIEIYSPEKDLEIFSKLLKINYPKEILTLDGTELKEILSALKDEGEYSQNQWKIQCFRGEALEYLERFDCGFFDVIYQDAFSPQKNLELWSEQYFSKLFILLKDDGVITTYSQSKQVSETVKKIGFYVYEIQQKEVRNSRLFAKKEINLPFLVKK
ncbi:tRNA (5-methylaminomethyl-2-thiouridine)(34)-methyltransferase MnmD [Helicobacter kayseriensis]|uniref:tRNA (5-methylaminomethyl-2-thiouridine)(34)-methyltransferase MnmD n=1 Tax=Helicobacter kayseriensis TaxID=2905877 RepID=UPI001E581842|nr:MnmC family methyltransferase [Helicobacter kayseriensis]MCE3046956.1 hypothetical protein [Helicobacter kayseriensis]MCE3048384.1 hypothetical protein [Helicobacter kayseriensis]